MKTIMTLMVWFISTQYVFGQIVPSSCSAPDSIIANFNADADRLTVRKIYRNNSTYKDSIEIPQNQVDTILNALIAVYNATTLPARDTVVTMFDIHSLPTPDLNFFWISADSNLAWMQQLRNGILATGNATIDSLTNLYHLNVSFYYTWFTHEVGFKSDSNYNIQPLAYIYETLPGVYSSQPGELVEDGNDIKSTIYSDHVELTYSFGWGDCRMGCMYRRFWKFKVYFDCSVEFGGSYGDALLITGVENNLASSISIFPNPFNNTINVTGSQSVFDYSIYNIIGETIMEGSVLNGRINKLGNLPSGYYVLQLKTNQIVNSYRLIKN